LKLVNAFHTLIATGGYSGYFPKIPGTFATVVGIFLYYPIRFLPFVLQGLLILFFFALGLWSSSNLEKKAGEKDPGVIVIDEIVGVWIALFLIPFQLKYLLFAFIFFRFFDIKKPLFIHPLQSLKGGWGIMLDDCLAGLYTNLVLQGIHYFWD
jgi:phosphatidylglycerophosphatase A